MPIKRHCLECKKEIPYIPGITFCSKRCSDIRKEKEYNDPFNGPRMPHLKAENITDEGYLALVKAIVTNASHDVTRSKPGTRVRAEAEKFFASEYFNSLTGLNGEAVLRDLQSPQKANARKTGIKRCIPRPVVCVETNEVFPSIEAAAFAHKCHASSIQHVLAKHRNRAGGVHWKYAEE